MELLYGKEAVVGESWGENSVGEILIGPGRARANSPPFVEREQIDERHGLLAMRTWTAGADAAAEEISLAPLTDRSPPC
jgi:hypothetical protein